MKQVLAALCCLAAAVTIACNAGEVNPESLRLRFAVIGNTSPDSPFAGFTDKLTGLITALNAENPVIVIHTGNMIQGGHDWMGINEKDLDRQFSIFFSRIKAVKPILYLIPGEKDCFNTSSALYEKYAGTGTCYSINYAKIHIAMVPLFNMANQSLESQVDWLEKDLAKHGDYPAILVVTHLPVVNASGQHLPEKMAERVHQIVKKYPVKAVISGHSGKLSETAKEGIRYIVAGCGGFSPEEKSKNLNQFYIVNFNGQDLFLEGKKI